MAKKQSHRKDDDQFNFRVNEEIKFYPQVRIVGENVESKVVSMKEAKRIAEEMELDLVEINNKVTPPIIKICAYDKLIYEMKKAAKKNKQNTSQLKEIQLTVNIASHDLQTKAKKAKEFINEGDKVKVTLTMKGRELNRREENKRSIFEFIAALEDVAIPESMPKDENNKTIVILKRKKNNA